MDFTIPVLIGITILIVIVIIFVKKERFIATLGRPFVQMGYSDYPFLKKQCVYNQKL